MKKNFGQNAIKVLICTFILVVAISCSALLWVRIDNAELTSYTCREVSYQPVALGTTPQRFRLVPVGTGLVMCQVPVLSQQEQDGVISVRLLESDNTVVFQQEFTVQNVLDEGVIPLLLSDSNLQKGVVYELELQGEITGPPIYVNQAKDGGLQNTQYFEFQYASLYKGVLVGVNLFLIIMLILSLLVKKKMKIHAWFLVLSLSTGVLFAFINPPLTVPDEYRHFVRQYQISTGNLIANQYSERDKYWEGAGYLPECEFPNELVALKLINRESSKTYEADIVTSVFFDKWINLFTTPWSGETTTTVYHGTSGISPLAYIPQILGILFAKLLRLPPAMLFYAARIGSVLFVTALLYLAIRITPCFKLMFFVVAMLPSVVFARASCSTDGFLLALIMLLVALILYYRERPAQQWNWKQYVVFILLAVGIGSIKFPYLCIYGMLLMLVVPYDKKNHRQWWCSSALLCMICSIAVALLVYKLGNTIWGIYLPEALESTNIPYLLANPIQVIQLVFQTFWNNISSYVLGTFGFADIFYLLGLVLLVQHETGARFQAREKWILFGLCVCLFGGLTFAGYFMAPPLGDRIWGIQARYFIPAIPFLLMLISGSKDKNVTDKFREELSCYTQLLVTGGAIVAIIPLCLSYYMV